MDADTGCNASNGQVVDGHGYDESMKQNSQNSVLLVEDDNELAIMVSEFLTSHGFAVSIESRGDQAASRILNENPDAVLLDINLPGASGFDVCRQARAAYRGPILMLSARGDEVDEVVGLEIGADDYISKPVRPRALLARLRTHLRKTPTSSSPRIITIGDLSLNSGRRTAEIAGEDLDLTTAEFDLLWLLAEKTGEVVSRNNIYQSLLEMPYDGVDRSIDLRVSRLRKKLNDDPAQPQRIKSVRGVGYILVSQE